MKKLLLLLMVLGLLPLPLKIHAAQVKLKYIGTIYTDAAGVALQEPAGVTITEDKLLIADSGGKRILTFTYQKGEVRPDQVFAVPEMYPLMVQPAANGGLYVLDGRARQITVLDAAGKSKGKFATKGVPGSERMVPRSIKTAPDGSLLVLDIFSERVLQFDQTGNFQRQFEFPQQYGAIADMSMDRAGNVYLVDSVEKRVYIYRTGADEFVALTPNMSSYMNFPTSLTTDNQGTLFLVDQYGSGLALVGIDGSFDGRRLGMGWSDSQLYYPEQVSINAAGDLFIADTKNNRVQHFSVAN